MANYVVLPCDNAGQFTSITATGTGATGFETTYHNEGSGAFATEVSSGAGSAYGIKTLDTNIGDGDYFHIAFDLLFMREWDFETPHNPDITGWTTALRLKSSATGKYIAFIMQNELGVSGNWKWVLQNSISGSDFASGDPDWGRSKYHRGHIYGFIHNSLGWYQYWSGALPNPTLHAQKTGIDTYPGDVYDQIYLGILWRTNTTTEVCFVYDDVLVDDAASPRVPGQRVRPKVNASLAGRGSRGGLVSGPSALREYRKLRRVA